jgi:hypothetical protein
MDGRALVSINPMAIEIVDVFGGSRLFAASFTNL